jgi:hypothetical protein
MQPPIPLASVLPADFDPATCKLHCAVFNGKNYPIDVLANDPAEWQRWNSWRGDKNDFNRPFILSLSPRIAMIRPSGSSAGSGR